ncbi:MAG TPA: cytochrome c maturation protein CcmE [Saprospiraceae bacterium]|mgnify:FL=1|nr:cytochrome c maturation protein CcmE [Saprospiraceae bacterium]
MKLSFLIALVFIGISIFLLINASSDLTSYTTFEQARTSKKEVKIVGQLAKDKEMVYNPEIDPNHFSFYVIDKKGYTQKVILKAAKPQDFELSEQIVITGKINGDDFIAKDVLLKCPSKYKDEEVYIKSES